MIIGLNGLKGAGKDTVGEFLVNNHGFERASFADKLKKSAAALWGFDPALWDKWKNDPHMRVMVYKAQSNNIWEVESGVEHGYYANTITVRQFLQNYGTEAHREIFGDDFWVDEAFKDIDPTKNYVFTDARFPNELQKIRDMSGFNVEILRWAGSNDSHVSEAAPPRELIDYVIYNGSTFDFLYREIEFVLDRIEEEVHGVKY